MKCRAMSASTSVRAKRRVGETGIEAGGHAGMSAACVFGKFFRFNGYMRAAKLRRAPSVHLRQR